VHRHWRGQGKKGYRLVQECRKVNGAVFLVYRFARQACSNVTLIQSKFILVCRRKLERQRRAMLTNRLPVFLAGFGLLPSIAVFGQSAARTAGGVFVSPDGDILNASYSAKRHFTSVTTHVDGTVDHSESGGSEARDSQGRTYSAVERNGFISMATRICLRAKCCIGSLIPSRTLRRSGTEPPE
jgi:hypothetical protein